MNLSEHLVLVFTLDYSSAAMLNRSLDILHSFFPTFSILGIFILLESFLPAKKAFESRMDRILTYIRLPFITVLTLTLVSQGFFGGCLIYYPQTWFNQTFLGIEQPYEYGLFGRQSINPQWWPALQLFYASMSILVLWRDWEFLKKRVYFSRFS